MEPKPAYDAMTKAELRAELDRRGLDYHSRSSGAELVELLRHNDGVPAELEDQGEGAPDPVQRWRGYLVKHSYQSGGEVYTRYGLVVDPDGPLVAWLQVEHVGHFADELEAP